MQPNPSYHLFQTGKSYSVFLASTGCNEFDEAIEKHKLWNHFGTLWPCAVGAPRNLSRRGGRGFGGLKRKNGNPLAYFRASTPRRNFISFFGNTLATLLPINSISTIYKPPNHENRSILQQFTPFREQILFLQHQLSVAVSTKQSERHQYLSKIRTILACPERKKGLLQGCYYHQ